MLAKRAPLGVSGHIPHRRKVLLFPFPQPAPDRSLRLPDPVSVRIGEPNSHACTQREAPTAERWASRHRAEEQEAQRDEVDIDDAMIEEPPEEDLGE
jgi:hypothetical protein